ncbi:MAG TPA: XdhC family protein [Burkholderiaceae bacterium]|jgi:xanthine dehydrogenase accessory factor|nr:XdhC family protein [Burkholderiaceae bacterium]
MTPTELFATAARLHDNGTEYALVSVVRSEAPTSARPGDKALVTGDGAIHGWIGGGCAQPAVIKTVRRALADGRARLIRIAPGSGGEREIGDVLEFGMVCHSGGTLELFVDPVLPPPRLVIFGASLVAVTLAQLAPRVGFAVSVAAQGADTVDFPDAQHVFDTDDAAALASQVAPGAYVVVATQGRRDLQALRAALALGPCYVGLVASHRKATVLKESLQAAGVDRPAVEAIAAPAGYPIAASTPEEIALSVLAALVAQRRGALPWAEPVRASGCEVAAVEARREPAIVAGAGNVSSCCGA